MEAALGFRVVLLAETHFYWWAGNLDFPAKVLNESVAGQGHEVPSFFLR
jgi:hypothetical protein